MSSNCDNFNIYIAKIEVKCSTLCVSHQFSCPFEHPSSNNVKVRREGSIRCRETRMRIPFTEIPRKHEDLI